MSCPFIKNGYAKTYGELTKKGLKQLLRNTQTKNKTFIDLGSGKGSVIINVANNYPQIKEIIGIELDPERHQIAKERVKNEVSKKNQKKIKLINGDILKDLNYSNCDLVYISNLCFSQEINDKISQKLNNELPSNSKVFTSKELSNINFSQKKNFTVNQSWTSDSSIRKYTIKNNRKKNN